MGQLRNVTKLVYVYVYVYVYASRRVCTVGPEAALDVDIDDHGA
jgi:hypothetical protein